MLALMFAYLFAVVMISIQYYLARRNQLQGWTKLRMEQRPPQEATMSRSPVDIEPFEDDRRLRHLAELTALNRALTEYHVPQKPEIAEVEMQKVAVRRNAPQPEVRGESSRF
jgi:hypothetical protein